MHRFSKLPGRPHLRQSYDMVVDEAVLVFKCHEVVYSNRDGTCG